MDKIHRIYFLDPAHKLHLDMDGSYDDINHKSEALVFLVLEFYDISVFGEQLECIGIICLFCLHPNFKYCFQ